MSSPAASGPHDGAGYRVVVHDDETTPLPAMSMVAPTAGTTLSIRTAGGGGYGAV